MNSPRIIRTVAGLRHVLQSEIASGKTIGLVPTMGALHEGHASLLKKARLEVVYTLTPPSLTTKTTSPSILRQNLKIYYS